MSKAVANPHAGTVLRYIDSLVVPKASRDATDRELLQQFVSRHDESAFATLVQRHASLVWHVCRQVLSHEQDAEDAPSVP
jgi:hypothetical protein